MATITDVAKKAGVAISTVSNVLNGVKYVSPETTKRVLEAVDALGYVANPIAHNMKSARSNMIGVIISAGFSSHPFCANAARSQRKRAFSSCASTLMMTLTRKSSMSA